MIQDQITRVLRVTRDLEALSDVYDCERWAQCSEQFQAEQLAVAEFAAESIQSLKDFVRIAEAVRYTAGLLPGQLERVERAKQLLAGAKV